MYYQNHNRLFSQDDINSFLQKNLADLKTEVKSLTLEDIKSMGEQKLIADLVKKYSVHVPILKEDEIKVDAKEGEVEVHGQRIFDDDRRSYNISGLIIFITIPFDGSPTLFNYRASTYSLSGTPEARIEEQNLILHYETVEKDSEKIKGLWSGDIKTIKQNLEWINRDVVSHNNSIEKSIQALIAKRKKEAEDNQSLINKIKG